MPATKEKGLDLSEAIATITSQTQVYTASKLPPAVPIPHNRWVPQQSPNAPHDEHSYFPMVLYQ